MWHKSNMIKFTSTLSPMRFKHLAGCVLIAGALSMPLCSSAQNQIIIEPLFEYPTPPDDYDDLTGRSDYLMDHFWDSFDCSSKAAVDQNALNDAFMVYTTAMRYANRDKALASVDALIKKLKGNPVLMLQFAKSAEENLFGPRASVWSDEAYLPFLQAVVSDKNISDTRKQRYSMQLDMLKRNAPGRKFPDMRLVLRNGRQKDFQPSAPLTLVEFGNPECDDCQFARTKLEMATDLGDMIEAGELEMVFVVADAVPEEQSELLESFKELPERWTAGICYGGDDIFDLRNTPSFYLIGPDKKIIAKNMNVTTAVNEVRRIKETSRKK